MHIGFLTPEYPHAQANASAGLGSSIKNLASSLVKEGIEVSVFIYGQSENERTEENGIHFHFIKQKKYKLVGWFLYRKHLQTYLNKYIEKEKIHIIEAPDWTGITAFVKLKCPLVIRMHGSDAYFCALEKRPQKKKNYWFEKKAILRADYLLSVSRFTAQKTSEIFRLDRPITVIPNGVDVDYFRPVQGKIVPNSILYFGSIIRKKGVLELANIFNKMVEFESGLVLVLMGKDVVDILENRSTLEIFRERLSTKALKRVKYVPEVQYEEVREYINSSAVVVLPSFAEALPMTWLETMAMEKALVASNIGWAGEIIIDGETGYMENPAHHDIFALKVLEILRSREQARKMGQAARQHVINKFSTEVVVEQNLTFYRKILAEYSE